MLPEKPMCGFTALTYEIIGPHQRNVFCGIQGNAFLTGTKIKVLRHEYISVNYLRVAQRISVEVDGITSLIVNTHLTHSGDDARRAEQMGLILDWIDKTIEPFDCVLIMGDLNATPHEPLHALLKTAGYVSLYAIANDREPERTFPSGLVAEGQDPDTDPVCLDYIYCRNTSKRATFRCESAFLAGAERIPGLDPPLYCSDHYFVVADIVLEVIAESNVPQQVIALF